ncbi:hypothetical protein HYW53_03405 [Candidatus Giovannonibacteria bacterium]|nr:hypothetical protein [Candidatus Giovannonibacteria bacterium]
MPALIAYAKSADEIIDITIAEVIQPFLIVLFALAAILFFWGVVQFIMNPDSEDKKASGRQHMIWGLIGLAIMFGVNGIIKILQNFVGQIK